MKDGSGPLWLGVIASIAILVFAVFFVILPARRAKVRAQNERMAAMNLKKVSLAEIDFRDNDRDGNGMKDFWTADLAGLFRAGLIERGIAEADVEAASPVRPRPLPFHGYTFVALRGDGSTAPPESYRQDTDQKSGEVHPLTKYGFLACPAQPGISGKYYFIINERNEVWRADVGFPIPQPKNWPSDSELQLYWSRPE